MSDFTYPNAPDPKMEALLRDWGIPFELVEVSVADIKQVPSAQVRDERAAISSRANPEEIETYALQMKRGAQFPPILVRSPNQIIDGNTRLEAARKCSAATIWAYRADIPTVDMALALGGALNQTNGKRLSVAEAQRFANVLRELGTDQKDIARLTGKAPAQISQWNREHEALKHAESVGLVDELRSLPANKRQALADIKLDEPFRRVVEAVVAAKPNVTEVKRLTRQLADAPSEAEQLEAVDATLASWIPQGPGQRVTRNETAHRARMVIPQIMNLGVPELFDPSRAEDDRALWQKLAAKVADVLEMFGAAS